MKYIIYLYSFLVLLSCKEAHNKTLLAKGNTIKNIHESIITIDTHDDINVGNFTDSLNDINRLNSQLNIPKMIEGDLDVSWLIVYTEQNSVNTCS